MTVDLQTVIFIVIAGVLWYFIQINDLFGMAIDDEMSRRDAILSALSFSLMAGLVFHFLRGRW